MAVCPPPSRLPRTRTGGCTTSSAWRQSRPAPTRAAIRGSTDRELEEASMTTRETVQKYLDGVAQRSGWQDLLADSVTFTSCTSPVKQLAGKRAYVEATGRFYSMVASLL